MLRRHKALLLSTWLGVLFLVQFDNFDRSTGFYWSYTLLLKLMLSWRVYDETDLCPCRDRCGLYVFLATYYSVLLQITRSRSDIAPLERIQTWRVCVNVLFGGILAGLGHDEFQVSENSHWAWWHSTGPVCSRVRDMHMMSHEVTWSCPSSQCHTILPKFAMSHDVTWCHMMSHDVTWSACGSH